MSLAPVRVKVIALGNADAGDDGVALSVLDTLAESGLSGLELVRAGRPGVGLLDLLESQVPVVLVDVVRTGAPFGTIVELPLQQVVSMSDARAQASSHSFGPSEVLRLAEALGRVLPTGYLVGIEGERFEAGSGLSEAVARGVGELAAAVSRRAAALAAVEGEG